MKKLSDDLKAKYENFVYDEDLINKKKNKGHKKEVPEDTIKFRPVEIISPYTGSQVNINKINNKFNPGGKIKSMKKNKKQSGYNSVEDFVTSNTEKNLSKNKSSHKKQPIDYDKVMRDALKTTPTKEKKASFQSIYNFPDDIAQGSYSAKYFLKVSQVLRQVAPSRIVTMQLSMTSEHKKVVVSGISVILDLLRKFTNYRKLKIYYVPEGSVVSYMEPVLKIIGPYFMFGYLESLILGIIKRMTSISTNAALCVKAAGNVPILFMGDRQDLFLTQPYDGYAAYIGGVHYQVTNAHLKYWQDLVKNRAVLFSSMPHAFVQMFDGDVVAATKAYLQIFPKEKAIPVVDYNNDVIADSLKLAKVFGEKLVAVRVDTSNTLIDKWFTKNNFGQDMQFDNSVYGVNIKLINALRKSLDFEGFHNLKIFVSGNFDVPKIKKFTQAKAPVDAYGVGSAILKINLDYSMNAVQLNGYDKAKVGWKNVTSSKLRELK